MSEKEIENDKQQALDKEEKENEQIREMGELTLDQNVKRLLGSSDLTLMLPEIYMSMYLVITP